MLLALCLAGRPFPRLRVSRVATWAGFLLGALVLATLAWAGHGAADPGASGNAHLVADILHLLAAGVWLGALVPLSLLLAETRSAGDRRSILVARGATARFSAMAVASVGTLVISGVVNTWFLAGTVPALVGTEYGRLLLLKLGLFAAMLLIAAVNLLRLSPRLADLTSAGAPRTIAQLQRNALFEAGLGLGVLAVVGILGTLPPGSHTQPRWPFPIRVEVAAAPVASQALLAVLAAVLCVGAITAVAAAAAGRYRCASIAAGGLALCLAVGWITLSSSVKPAYPTSFYAPTEPYAADSIVRGAELYATNCAVCHGAGGHGDGPAAAGLPVRPADLTEVHLFAHKLGDLFWWVGHGYPNGAMPGFASAMNPSQRWDVINFLLARAAGVQTREVGLQVTAAAAYPLPDLAFDKDGAQETLRRVTQRGPVLLVLFGPSVPVNRLQELAQEQPRFRVARLTVLAIRLAGPREASEEARVPSLAVGVSPEVIATLSLFRAPADGNETELMLDRNGNVRARWARNAPGGLPPPETLAAAAARVAQIPLAPLSRSGHVH